MTRRLPALLTAVILLLFLAACGGRDIPDPTPTPDPHAGEVLVSDGAGGSMWVPLYEELPLMELDGADFTREDGYIRYTGTDAQAITGIDVSEHQQEIDWAAVAADGVEFAIIRTGYRGYTEGALFEDACFRANIQGALAAGLQVGVYFFSQATTPQEAVEEAHFLLEQIAPYSVALPVAYDWETIQTEPARTDGMSGAEVTQCALAFCREIRAAGYQPAVYFYRSLGYLEYELDALENVVFWAGAPGETPDFYYRHEIWQYSFTGQVDGIAGDCDLNLYFTFPEPEPSPSPSPESSSAPDAP